jgi:hypothetical protein
VLHHLIRDTDTNAHTHTYTHYEKLSNTALGDRSTWTRTTRISTNFVSTSHISSSSTWALTLKQLQVRARVVCWTCAMLPLHTSKQHALSIFFWTDMNSCFLWYKHALHNFLALEIHFRAVMHVGRKVVARTCCKALEQSRRGVPIQKQIQAAICFFWQISDAHLIGMLCFGYYRVMHALLQSAETQTFACSQRRRCFPLFCFPFWHSSSYATRYLLIFTCAYMWACLVRGL